MGRHLTQGPLKSLSFPAAFQADDEGSIPFTRSNNINGLIRFWKQRRAGSRKKVHNGVHRRRRPGRGLGSRCLGPPANELNPTGLDSRMPFLRAAQAKCPPHRRSAERKPASWGWATRGHSRAASRIRKAPWGCQRGLPKPTYAGANSPGREAVNAYTAAILGGGSS